MTTMIDKPKRHDPATHTPHSGRCPNNRRHITWDCNDCGLVYCPQKCGVVRKL